MCNPNLATCEIGYFATLDRILNEQNAWRNQDAILGLARIMGTVGIDEEKVLTCANDKGVAKAIFETQQATMRQFGVKTTPTFFVAGMQLDGKNAPHVDSPGDRGVIGRVVA